MQCLAWLMSSKRAAPAPPMHPPTSGRTHQRRSSSSPYLALTHHHHYMAHRRKGHALTQQSQAHSWHGQTHTPLLTINLIQQSQGHISRTLTRTGEQTWWTSQR